MEIFITAYSKNMPNHNVFMGELKSEYIRDIPSPAGFSRNIRCSAVKSNSIYAPEYEPFYTGRDGKFEPIFRMHVAAELRLNGNYRIQHVFRKSELITMLASVLNKADLPDVVRQISDLVGE